MCVISVHGSGFCFVDDPAPAPAFASAASSKAEVDGAGGAGDAIGSLTDGDAPVSLLDTISRRAARPGRTSRERKRRLGAQPGEGRPHRVPTTESHRQPESLARPRGARELDILVPGGGDAFGGPALVKFLRRCGDLGVDSVRLRVDPPTEPPRRVGVWWSALCGALARSPGVRLSLPQADLWSLIADADATAVAREATTGISEASGASDGFDSARPPPASAGRPRPGARGACSIASAATAMAVPLAARGSCSLDRTETRLHTLLAAIPRSGTLRLLDLSLARGPESRARERARRVAAAVTACGASEIELEAGPGLPAANHLLAGRDDVGTGDDALARALSGYSAHRRRRLTLCGRVDATVQWPLPPAPPAALRTLHLVTLDLLAAPVDVIRLVTNLVRASWPRLERLRVIDVPRPEVEGITFGDASWAMLFARCPVLREIHILRQIQVVPGAGADRRPPITTLVKGLWTPEFGGRLRAFGETLAPGREPPHEAVHKLAAVCIAWRLARLRGPLIGSLGAVYTSGVLPLLTPRGVGEWHDALHGLPPDVTGGSRFASALGRLLCVYATRPPRDALAVQRTPRVVAANAVSAGDSLPSHTHTHTHTPRPTPSM